MVRTVVPVSSPDLPGDSTPGTFSCVPPSLIARVPFGPGTYTLSSVPLSTPTGPDFPGPAPPVPVPDGFAPPLLAPPPPPCTVAFWLVPVPVPVPAPLVVPPA